jgi:hypothetical protein
MKARTRFVLGCLLVGASVVACSSEDHSGSDSTAGASGAITGGTQSGGSNSAAGGSTASGGSADPNGGTPGTAGTSSSTGGTKAGVGGGGGHPAAGTGGMATMGVAGADTSAAGEAGAANQPPPPLLQNGSFELGTLSFWTATVTPSEVGRAIYTQWGPYDSNTRSIDGKYEAAFWNGTSPFQGDLNQTVTGLTPGKYELKLYVAFGLGLNAAYVYAINCGPQDVTQDLPIADGAADFIAVSLPSIDVTNSSCTVGIFADMHTGDWLNVDDFVLNRLPPPAN